MRLVRSGIQVPACVPLQTILPTFRRRRLASARAQHARVPPRPIRSADTTAIPLTTSAPSITLKHPTHTDQALSHTHTPCRRCPRPTSCLLPQRTHLHPRSTSSRGVRPSPPARVRARYRGAHRAASSAAWRSIDARNTRAFQPCALAVHPRALAFHCALWSTTRTAFSTACAASRTSQTHARVWREGATAGGRGGGAWA